MENKKEETEMSEIEQICESVNMEDPGKKLRMKIERITSTIKNLESKKLSLELEIKNQKKVLNRKRNELKKVSKSNSIRLSTKIESTGVQLTTTEQELLDRLKNLDQRLLRESARILEN